MNFVKKTIIILFLLIVFLFAFQNFETVNITFYKWHVEIPLTLAIIATYIVGALTGGLLFSLMKKVITMDKKNDS